MQGCQAPVEAVQSEVLGQPILELIFLLQQLSQEFAEKAVSTCSVQFLYVLHVLRSEKTEPLWRSACS